MASFLLLLDRNRRTRMRNSHVRFVLSTLAAASLGAAPALAVDSDAEFVKKAANAGMMEVELGRYASQHASSPNVREFGETMVSDHDKANQSLKDVAKKQNLAVPTAMDEEHRDKVAELTKLKGREFDEAYMDAMVKGHEDVVDAFKEQGEESKTEIDRWAAKTLPTLESHLTHARTISKSVQSGGVGAGPANRGQDAGSLGRGMTTDTGNP
jgi:putative membrane protein